MPQPKDPATPDTGELEGEGNYTAARRYDQATEKYIQSGAVPGAAERAKEAYEGEEGDELRRAEEEAKHQASDIELDKDIPEKDVEDVEDEDDLDLQDREEGDVDLEP